MNFDWDLMTVIAGVLGFFFLVVALFKNFGKRNTDATSLPGMRPPGTDDDEEVKFSDPFLDSNDSQEEAEVAEEPVKPKTGLPSFDRSAFKQFAPDASTVAEVTVRTDSDYQWE